MDVPELSDSRLLEFSRRLQFATDYESMLNELCREVREATGYNTAWIGVYLPDKNSFKILTLQAEGVPVDWDNAAEIPIAGDPFISEMIENGTMVLVEDAQSDPRVNREIVEQLGNRTVINLPMSFGDLPFGALGTGTFGEEGVKLPTTEQLEYLQKLTKNVTAASVRILQSEQRRSEREAKSESIIEELSSIVDAIRADASALPGDAAKASHDIVERAERAVELLEAGRDALSSTAGA